jgi:scyllo-inositol 2-dehydrogenase (NADP+)
LQHKGGLDGRLCAAALSVEGDFLMERTIRVGVIGFGLAGQVFHTAVIDETPGLELACIVQRTGESAAQRYPRAKIARSVEEMLGDASIELCVVATPNDTHFPLAAQCLRAGRNVVVDKPVTLSSADAEALAVLAREQRRVFAPYHNRRWDGDFQTLHGLLASGRLGEPRVFESHFDRFRLHPKPGAWRETEAAGGGTLFDLGPHLIDQALALFGAPTHVWADVRIAREGVSVDDTFDVELTYAGSRQEKLRVWLRAGILAASPGARFTLHGTAGSFEKRGLDPQEAALKNGALFADAGFGVDPEPNWGTLTFPDGRVETVPTGRGDYRGYYGNVRDAILGVAPLAVTPGAAWSVARIMEAARESSRTGCRVAVDLRKASQL